jgi:hypothetical protein
LAFIHYRVESAKIRLRLPPQLRLQEFDGSAWIGLVPFRMSGVMRRPFPDIPFLSTFPEMNLRTYVEFDNKPGVWFFSLDADSLPMVFGGRCFYQLPYFSAQMSQFFDSGWYHFTSRRRGGRAELDASFRPTGESFFPKEGTFEHWMAERYCLYSARDGLSRIEVQHALWPIQRAQLTVRENSVLSASGLNSVGEPLVHFSPGVHVVSFGMEKAGQRPH